MLRRKGCHVWATGQVSQTGTNCVGVFSPLWKEKSSSDLFQAVPNSVGYLEPLEDTAWSQNVDSAASMYPPPMLPSTRDVTAWGECYQDLSSWCSKQQQNMVVDTKGSSCTVKDDDLNTPEVGVQHEFNFTASCNVFQEDILQYLSDRWETSPPLYVPQKSLFEDSMEKTDTDNIRSVTANEFFIDDNCVLPVSHEEEIVTSHTVEELVHTKQTDIIKESVNLYEFGVAHGVKSMDGNCTSVGKDSLVVITVDADRNTDITLANDANTNEVASRKFLFGSDFCVRTEVNDVPLHTNELQADENLTLNNLLSGSICNTSSNHVETSLCDTILSKVMDTELPRNREMRTPLKSSTYTMLQTVVSEEGAAKLVPIDVQKNTSDFAEQEEPVPSMFGTDVCVKVEQKCLPMSSELTEAAVCVQNSAQSVMGIKSASHVESMHTSREMLHRDLGLQPEMKLKENPAGRNLQLSLSTTLEGSDVANISTPDVTNINTPDVMEFLSKNGKFDLLAYLFSSQELVPVNGDDTVSASCTGEAPKVEPTPNDAELMGVSQSDAAIKVDHERNDSMFEHVELGEEEVDCSPTYRLDQPFEGQTRASVKKNLQETKSQQIRKDLESRNVMQHDSALESTILQDGTDLRLKISKVKVSTGQTSSTKVALPRGQVSQTESGAELKVLLSHKRTRGRPSKRTLPSTSKDETYSARVSSRRRSGSGEAWIPSAKRTKHNSRKSCDRYRELRDKNNEASRKSRQNRKARESDMNEYSAQLERENESLKIKADEMERLVTKLREALLEAVVKTKKQ